MKDRIVEAYLKEFRERFGFTALDEAAAFEHFVNHNIISRHHPDPFDPEDITVGGSGDLGIDGLGILVNDHLVFEASAVDYLKRQLQIVNGCQTSHVLYLNRERLTDKVYLSLKLIVTADSEVTNQVIQGTNRQTEVKLEAFESLAPFQKKLEELYLALGKAREPLYYERRSKQYDHLEVGRERIVTLPTQISCFVAMFLNEPHSTHRYYGELLNSYRNRLFSESHLPISYYVSALTLAALERLFSRGRISRNLKPLKYQMLMVFRIQNGGVDMPPLNSRAIEKYCDKLLGVLDEEANAEQAFIHAGELLESVQERMSPWREPPQRTRAFTTALLEAGAPGRDARPATTVLTGGRVKWFSDIKGYGFVTSDDGHDVFVHQSALFESGIRTLMSGQRLQFTKVQRPKGLEAVYVEFE